MGVFVYEKIILKTRVGRKRILFLCKFTCNFVVIIGFVEWEDFPKSNRKWLTNILLRRRWKNTLIYCINITMKIIKMTKINQTVWSKNHRKTNNNKWLEWKKKPYSPYLLSCSFGIGIIIEWHFKYIILNLFCICHLSHS